MAIVKNFLFGKDNTGPFSSVLSCQGRYNKQYVRRFTWNYSTPEIFSFTNEGWGRALLLWNNLSEEEKEQYNNANIDPDGGGFVIFLRDNLLLSYSFLDAIRPLNPLYLSSELETKDGLTYIKIKYQRVVDILPDFSQLEFIKLYKGVNVDPEFKGIYNLLNVRFSPDILKVGNRWKITQFLLNDYDIQENNTYIYRLLTSSYSILTSLNYEESITTY
jgi:hypothetical protein